MSHVRLIISAGTQEPRIRAADGQFYLLKDRKEIRVQRLLSERGNPGQGLYAAAKLIFDSMAAKPATLSFPILHDAVRFVVTCEQRIDSLFLVATAPPEGSITGLAAAQLDDTYWCARLAHEHFLPTQSSVISSRIVELRHRQPHIYRVARDLIRRADLLAGLDNESRIYVCTSPGLPAVNQAIVQRVLHSHGGHSVLFQVIEPEAEKLLAGQSSGETGSIAEADFVAEMVGRDIRLLVGKYNYSAAADLLSRIPDRPGLTKDKLLAAIKDAATRWSLHYDESAYTGPYDRYLVRAWLGREIASALFEIGENDDAIVWAGDTTALLEDWYFAVALKNPSYLTKFQHKNSHALDKAYKPGWDALNCFHNKSRSWRNDFTHRLRGKDELAYQAWLANNAWSNYGQFLAELDTHIVSVAQFAGILDAQSFRDEVAPFQQLNQLLAIQIDRLIGDQE